MLHRYYASFVNSILNSMRQLQIDKTEFLVLLALLYCSLGSAFNCNLSLETENLPSEYTERTRLLKAELLDEAQEYCRRAGNRNESGIRLSKLILLIPPMQVYDSSK